ncbi:MAG: magnesium transporter CorA family protein [Patescibacteria group bacterium]
MNKNITTLKSPTGNLAWINIISAQKKEIEYLRRKYKFNELDLKDSFASQYAQRPKFYQRQNYCFLILQFPFYNSKSRSIEPEEVDFFIGRDFVITVHKNNLPPLTEIFNLCSSDEFYCRQYLTGNNAALLYEIIVRLQEYCYPILDHISLDVKNIEKNIFAGHERRMVTEILNIKRNILNFRKIMENHKNVIQKIIHEGVEYFPVNKQKAYYNNLIEHTKNIWDLLNSHKEMIEALEDTNGSLVYFKLNDIMRTLTVFSVLILPLSLISGIFGMNTVIGMPFLDNQAGFWGVIILMLLTVLFLLFIFKKKKLL